MHKNKQTWSVKTLVFLALLVAIQLVLSRVLVIDLGVYRITLGLSPLYWQVFGWDL